ncbi:MAG TPA: sulfur oxidation c-type cytochrome SoxA [Azospirillum sp.]|nr:sulfur oxidation c-type cytochrome SoxA [Azospirillum sp.]
MEERRSGFAFMGPDSQAMQREDTANPGMLWVGEGEALWSRKEGAAGQACADCHGAADRSMRGVAARYPAFDAELGRPLDLTQRIKRCREVRQSAAPLPYEDEELLVLTAFVAHQSRGLPLEPDADPRMEPFRERGRQLFQQRQGQLDLACSQCHDDNWGRRLAGTPIPQGHPTGYPLYRLEWQGLGSLQRRFRNCQAATRTEPYAYGSAEYVDIEAYLMWRARGMPMETPAVRP